MCISHFVYLLIGSWTFGLIYLLAYVNSAASNMGVQIFFQTLPSILLDIWPEVRVLDHMIELF